MLDFASNFIKTHRHIGAHRISMISMCLCVSNFLWRLFRCSTIAFASQKAVASPRAAAWLYASI